MTETKPKYGNAPVQNKGFFFVVSAETLAPFTQVKHTCIHDAYAELVKLVREYGAELIIAQTMVKAEPKIIVGKATDFRPPATFGNVNNPEDFKKKVESYLIANGFRHDDLRDTWEKSF